MLEVIRIRIRLGGGVHSSSVLVSFVSSVIIALAVFSTLKVARDIYSSIQFDDAVMFYVQSGVKRLDYTCRPAHK